MLVCGARGHRNRIGTGKSKIWCLERPLADAIRDAPGTRAGHASLMDARCGERSAGASWSRAWAWAWA